MPQSPEDISSRFRTLQHWFTVRKKVPEDLPTEVNSGHIPATATSPERRSPSPASEFAIHREPATSSGMETQVKLAESQSITAAQWDTSKDVCSVCGDLARICIVVWFELVKSAKSGCQACELLVDGVDAYFGVTSGGLRHYGSKNIVQKSTEKTLQVHTHPSRGALEVGIGWLGESGLIDQCEFYTEIHEQVCPWAGLNAARSVARETRDSHHVLQEWVQQCITTHPGCSNGVGILPLRVIDVGQPGTEHPFLYISQGESAAYTALSHCWGSTALLKTTTSNINSHRRELDWIALSKTFRDAIAITQDLGVRYLWIDSICILQDDNMDWEAQSRQMATIYSNARVVLVATDAEDGRGGLLTRNPSRPRKGPFTITPKTGKSFSVFVRSTLRHFSFRLQGLGPGIPLEHPLLKRAWAFQEELLATRIVHYTKSELIWECQTSLACECMNLDTFDPRSPKLLYHRSLLPTAKEEDKFINWQHIVTSYMSKDISFEKDRIPALAGLAAQMQTAGAGQYLGGLWRKNLLLDLLWISSGSRRRAHPRKSPTWSWASTEGSKDSLFYHRTTTDRALYPIEKIHARIIDIKWELSDQDLTRTDANGALTLAAPLIEVQIYSHERDQRRSGGEVRRGELRANYQPDIQGYKSTRRVFGLLIAVAIQNWRNTERGVQALILEEVENECHIYERIGSMCSHVNPVSEAKMFHPGLWFGGIEDSIVTII